MSSLRHVRRGDGMPPMVFVHGYCCSHSDWNAQLDHFGQRHTAIAVDLPGHGASPAGEVCSIEHCAAELAAFLQVRSLPPTVLIGHSMGCRVILQASRLAPEQVLGLILVDGSQFAPAYYPLLSERFAAGEHKEVVGGMFEQMFTSLSDPATAASVIKRALAMPEANARALLLSLVRYDLDKLGSVLEETKHPLLALQTTYIGADRQRASLRSGQTTPYLDLLRAKVPSARIEVLPGVGHFPQLDAPAETNLVIERFVASIARGN